ncbi:hypothetical protein LZ198_37500 [Myxococcus sp. K15C18031901]|uniref:TadE/TadG family type IV pilus assembly protein n=1 Tax=Myxococcus dinghuensis TaxID=2906761 RepID=UPI0020A7B0F0|nr:hypothetical protein [Myxococcus dinghuensis]MCP3104574.1 hypothetical protein [Myxococcus dinghuensis]
MHPSVLLLSRTRRRAQRGQAIVLGSLSFLVLALMVTLSFNLSHALRRKISLQQHSDALSYSMAVLEARALNYYAVSNRAVASAYVAGNSLHAFMAAASVTGEMLRASGDNFVIIAGLEMLKCPTCYYKCIEHCIHAIQAMKISGEFKNKGREYDQKVKGFESDFNEAMQGLDDMVDGIHTAQRSVHDKTIQAVKDGSSHGLAQLKEYSAPGASDLNSSVGSINANEFNCAVDGMECQGSVGNSSPEARARVMTEISNATRSGWPANRKISAMGTDKPPYLNSDFFKELKDIPGEGRYLVSPHKGTAKTVKSKGSVDSGGQSGGNEGTTLAAHEEGRVTHWWKHNLMGSTEYDSDVWSDENGGGHTGNGAHSGQHRFEGVNAKALTGCAGSGNCFMKFRANPSSDRDWGQPRVYSYLTMAFRVGNTRQAPWELNTKGQVRYEHGAQGAGELTVAPGDGVAMSKSLVYYHRFGENGWQEAPNLFAPYWRAKLHPFKQGDAKQVLDAAGNSDASQASQAEGVPL